MEKRVLRHLLSTKFMCRKYNVVWFLILTIRVGSLSLVRIQHGAPSLWADDDYSYLFRNDSAQVAYGLDSL